jgi:nucleotide-binding universal stress UspA family protein
MFKEILLPINMDETGLTERAIATAQDIAEQHGANLTVLTAIPDFSSSLVASYFPEDAIKNAHEETFAELKKFVDAHFKKPADAQCAVREGSPRKVIVEYVEEHNVDLVVMPARKTDISKVFLGSNSSHVANHAPCSVLVVRP